MNSSDYFPNKKIIQSNLIEKLRYGENPHQEGAIYSSNKNMGILQLNGKKLSYILLSLILIFEKLLF
mgnify:CR=1 FL=1